MSKRKSLTVRSLPDVGLMQGLGLDTLPKDGLAYELGSGTARNTIAMSKVFPDRTTAFELDDRWIEKAIQNFEAADVSAQIRYQDVLDLNFEPDTLSIVGIGMLIYLPKSKAIKLLKDVWVGLKKFGVLHMEFPTPADDTKNDDFFIHTSLPYPEKDYPNSYNHYCEYDCMSNHPGAIGIGFWEENEILTHLANIGGYKLIYCRKDEWKQQLPMGTKFRSFYRVTVQKTA